MIIILGFTTLLFLVLLQVSAVPLNLAFVSVLAYSLFLNKTAVLVWLIVLAILVSLLANIPIGVVLLAFGTTFFILKFGAEFLPENNLIKVFLLVVSLPLSEMFILLFSRAVN